MKNILMMIIVLYSSLTLGEVPYIFADGGIISHVEINDNFSHKEPGTVLNTKIIKDCVRKTFVNNTAGIFQTFQYKKKYVSSDLMIEAAFSAHNGQAGGSSLYLKHKKASLTEYTTDQTQIGHYPGTSGIQFHFTVRYLLESETHDELMDMELGYSSNGSSVDGRTMATMNPIRTDDAPYNRLPDKSCSFFKIIELAK